VETPESVSLGKSATAPYDGDRHSDQYSDQYSDQHSDQTVIVIKGFDMAETYSSATDKERTDAPQNTGLTATDGTPSPIGVYDRPERPVRSTSNMAGIFLLLLVLAILAYFLFQWLT
jgi:hypothetical protein